MKEDIRNMKSQEEWLEKAINNSKECWKSFILSRVEIALIKISKIETEAGSKRRKS